METPNQAAYMRMALDAARSVAHRTSPNPVVGCVIVKGDQVVGTGITQPVGQAHAEVMALRDAGPLAEGADMYVTLEPCCHVGRTGPCTEAIIEAGIARVFVGVIDPNPVVHGKGLRILESAGVETAVGVLGEECSAHYAAFTRYIQDGRPWVILKAGVTLDGCIATTAGDSKWITGEASRADAHRLRAHSDAVLVGAETAVIDEPKLTVRMAPGTDPLRVVLDSTARTPADSPVLGERAILFHGPSAPAERIAKIAATGAETALVETGPNGLDLSQVLAHLAKRGVVSLLVEGGGRVHASFLEARLVDEACLYMAPKLIGQGRPVVASPSSVSIAEGWSLDPVEAVSLGSDVRIRGRVVYPGER